METGVIEPALSTKITGSINSILAKSKKKSFKIGKTGHSSTRTDQLDYRSASYTKMYLLHKSSVTISVSELEEYYIQKYFKSNDNINKGSRGSMKSPDGSYYLYLVI